MIGEAGWATGMPKIGIVYLMTVKPGWVASVVGMLIALAIGVASAQPAWSRKRALMAAGDASVGTPQAGVMSPPV
jgi:hypothetical protein